MTKRSPFRYFKTSPEIIRLAVMMYVRYPLSLRNVEDLLHERGIDISHETVRFWWNRFGPMFAGDIRKRRVRQMHAHSNWRWYLGRAINNNELSQRLTQVPGIGLIGATMLALKTPDPHSFRSARHFAAWIGLTPRDHSTGGKNRVGSITRAGDEMLRSVLVLGATAVISKIRSGKGRCWPWLERLVQSKPPKLVAVALANKLARIAWKLMTSGQGYRPALAMETA